MKTITIAMVKNKKDELNCENCILFKAEDISCYEFEKLFGFPNCTDKHHYELRKQKTKKKDEANHE